MSSPTRSCATSTSAVEAWPDMLEVERLRSGYGGIPVLADLSLTVSGGEFVGILGHNGMGKTTPLRALIAILPATALENRLDGVPITRASSLRRARLDV